MRFKRLYIDGCGAPLVAMESPDNYELHLYDYDGVCSMLNLPLANATYKQRKAFWEAKTALENCARDRHVKL